MLPRRISLIATAALALAAPAAAQSTALNAEPSAPAAPAALAPSVPQQAVTATRAVPAVPAAPAIGAAATGLQPAPQVPAALAQEDAALQARARANFSQSQVLMIVGGTALITGLVIGDSAGDVLAIGGAAVGLYGLYRYLQGR